MTTNEDICRHLGLADSVFDTMFPLPARIPNAGPEVHFPFECVDTRALIANVHIQDVRAAVPWRALSRLAHCLLPQRGLLLWHPHIRRCAWLEHITRSGANVTRLLCDPSLMQNVLKYRTRKIWEPLHFSFQYKSTKGGCPDFCACGTCGEIPDRLSLRRAAETRSTAQSPARFAWEHASEPANA
jgi:hypothetical protein